MYNANIPENRELPSTAKLVKSTALAGVAAVVLLVTTVLPAEYGIDPTGVGNMLGLKKVGEIKVSLAEEAAAEELLQQQAKLQVAPAPQVVEVQEEVIMPEPVEVASAAPEVMTVTLVPNQGAEIKAKMKKGETVTYKWYSDAGKANFDVHGDSVPLNISYHNYEKGSETLKEGSLTAAFDGSHGWFWRNRTSQPLTVTIEVSGEYTALHRVK